MSLFGTEIKTLTTPKTLSERANELIDDAECFIHKPPRRNRSRIRKELNADLQHVVARMARMQKRETDPWEGIERTSRGSEED